MLILPTEDPLTKLVFAASEKDLMDVYSYRKVLRELQAKAAGRAHEDEEPGEESAAAAGAGSLRRRGARKEPATKEK